MEVILVALEIALEVEVQLFAQNRILTVFKGHAKRTKFAVQQEIAQLEMQIAWSNLKQLIYGNLNFTLS